MNNGDTAWLLTASALVMLMTPALAFFYGGLVRHKNVLSTIMYSFFTLCLISVQWVLWGYSITFGPDHFGLFGGLEWFGLNGVGAEPNADYAATVPHQTFMLYQMMLAIITPALISGAFAERMKFSAFILFTLLWATLVYDPVAHWVWAVDGWLRTLGVLDFGGGYAVHINAGVAALVCALVLGRRVGMTAAPVHPHDVTYVVLGGGLLWFGWFGFNAGGAVTAGALATSAFLVTNTSAAVATLAWVALTWGQKGWPSVSGAAIACVAGLVAITPASGYVDIWAAMLIGLVAGVGCYYAIAWVKDVFKIDDALDVFGVHGVGGAIGVLATGLFATVAVNSAAANGLFFGNPSQLVVQALAMVVVAAYSGGATFLILKLVDVLVGLRVSQLQETVGLDIALHGETAYQLVDPPEFGGTGGVVPAPAQSTASSTPVRAGH